MAAPEPLDDRRTIGPRSSHSLVTHRQHNNQQQQQQLHVQREATRATTKTTTTTVAATAIYSRVVRENSPHQHLRMKRRGSSSSSRCRSPQRRSIQTRFFFSLFFFSSSPPLIEPLWRSARRASAAVLLSGWTEPRSGLEQGGSGGHPKHATHHACFSLTTCVHVLTLHPCLTVSFGAFAFCAATQRLATVNVIRPHHLAVLRLYDGSSHTFLNLPLITCRFISSHAG